MRFRTTLLLVGLLILLGTLSVPAAGQTPDAECL